MTESAPRPAAPTVLIEICHIDPDPDNVRLTPTSAADDDNLATSMREQGQIEPIGVRANPDADGRFVVIFGERRLRCAIKLGWLRIEATDFGAIDPITAKAMQVAENAHRADMHPLDTWKAMVSLQAKGMTLQLAAQCLGINDRRARQLDRLGRIAPPLIEAMRKSGIPDERYLARISEAPADAQMRVFKRIAKGAGNHIAWWQIANDLTSSMISRASAIFDTDAVKDIAWQEDVFAQPGSKDAFTTTNAKAFMKHQTVALQAQIAKRVKRGEHVEIATFDDSTGRLRVPEGYEHSYDRPKSMKLPKTDPRVLTIGIAPDGSIREQLIAEKGKRVPKAAKKVAKPAAGDDDTASAPAVAAPPRTITNGGLQILAVAKTVAIRSRLSDDHGAMQLVTLLQLLCVAACGNNVTIIDSGVHGRARMADILRRMVTPEGRLNKNMDFLEVKAIAAEIIARMSVVTSPTQQWIGSGVAATIIGDAIEAANCMEPLDSPDFLKTLSLPALKAAAEAAEITGAKTASALRERLTGKIGTRWRPEEAEFVCGALAPLMEDDPEEDDAGDPPSDEDEAEAA